MTVILLSCGSRASGDGNWRHLTGSESTESWKLVKLPCTGTVSGKVKLLIFKREEELKPIYYLYYKFVLFFPLNICTVLCSYKGRLAFCRYCCLCPKSVMRKMTQELTCSVRQACLCCFYRLVKS